MKPQPKSYPINPGTYDVSFPIRAYSDDGGATWTAIERPRATFSFSSLTAHIGAFVRIVRTELKVAKSQLQGWIFRGNQVQSARPGTSVGIPQSCTEGKNRTELS